MLISVRRDEIYVAIKELYFRSGITNLFDVSFETHDKIVLHLAKLVIEEGFLESCETNRSTKSTIKDSAVTVAALFLNSLTFFTTILKYYFIPFLFRMVVRAPQKPLESSENPAFVFLNSAGVMDRLIYIIGTSFKKNEYRIYYILTQFIQKIYERAKNDTSIRFIVPQIPDKNAIIRCLKFLFVKGPRFSSGLFKYFENHRMSERMIMVSIICQYLYSLIIYHQWALKKAYDLSSAYPNSLFVFDIDEASKELMIADALNRLGKKTLLIQHGILIDPKQYIPTCKYMVCASERERQSLISEGIEAKRLFAVGQSLQTIKDSKFSEVKKTVTYPLLILASNGPHWLQRLYVDMLKHSKILKQFERLDMRPHPAFSTTEKKLWSIDRRFKYTDMSESLGKCIAKSHLVISFSIDALTVAVRQGCPTIVCIPEKFFAPEWHNFLDSIPMVRVAKTPQMLDAILADTDFKSSRKQDFSELQWKYVDFAFGELNTKTNLTSLMRQLAAEIEK